jgi:hypothetical protein
MASLYELCRRSEHGIYAVPYRGRRARKALRLPDGAIAEAALPDQRCEVPYSVHETFGVAHGGMPATIHHANLGLIVGYLHLSGIFLLPDGDVAAVYGADVTPLGVGPVPVA